MRTIPLVLVLVLASYTDALAQQQPLQPGQRIRVTAPNSGMNKQAATFEAVESGVLLVTADSTMRCPLAAVTRLDVYRGQQGHFWLGAGIGLGVGAAAGVVIGLQLCENDWVCQDDLQAEAALLGFGIGGAVGGLLGGGIGALIKTDRWEEVPLDRLRVSVVPQRGGRLGFGVSVSF